MAIIIGTSDPDLLDGTAFDDTITAQGGNDTVFAWSGDDLIELGSGDDRSESGLGNDTVYGGLGNDTILADGGILAGGGDDQIFGGGGNDQIVANDRDFAGLGHASGGAGDDRILVYSTSGGIFRGGTGTDQIIFDDTTDEDLLIDFDNNLLAGGTAFSPGDTFSGFERLGVGTGLGDDTIMGGSLADQLSVGGGANSVDAKAGDDTVSYTARDANTLRGGEGIDTLIVSNSIYFIARGDGTVDDGGLSDILGFERYVLSGSDFADFATLGAKNDAFIGGRGSDTAFGNEGADTLSGEAGDDWLEGGAGRDRLQGGNGNDTIVSDAGLDRVSGGAGDDRVRVFDTAGGAFDGGTGTDLIRFINATDQDLFIDIDNAVVDGGAAFALGVTFESFEQLRVLTDLGDDTVLGGAFDDRIRVGVGANIVDAKAGDDFVAYTDNDTQDRSTLRGGEGDDTLFVDSGFPTLAFIISFDGSIGDQSGSDILGFEHFVAQGGDLDDTVGLGDSSDVFRGAGGNDSAYGRDGADILSGNDGNDWLMGEGGRDRLFGGNGDDSIGGHSGNDRIKGGAGDDSIRGGGGDDSIWGGTGNNHALGGSGADTFVFTSIESGFDTILDFETGNDVLHFIGLTLPLGPAAGPLDPSLLALGAASGPQAQFVLTYSTLPDMTTLLWDPNGDDPSGASYNLVSFSGEVTLTATDIVIL